jgi:O-antigen ligase
VAYQQSQELTELVSPLPAVATKAAQPAPFVYERSQWSACAAKFGSLLLFVTVAAAPLPFGSNQPAPIALWCIVLGAALLFLPLRGLSGGQLALIGFGLFVVAAYALVLHEQLAKHPWLPVAVPHPLWRQAQEALGVPLAPFVSIARNEPWFELGRPLVCFLAIACGFLVGADEERGRQLMKVIAWSGAIYAAYGIFSHLWDSSRILWLEKTAYLEDVTGTFINRNTAGTYFGSCAVVCLLLLCESVRWQMPPGPIDWGAVPSRALSAHSKGLVATFSMFFLCLLALFMTGSRGAVVICLPALILTFIIFFRRHLPRRSGIAAAIVAGGAIALLLLQFMGAGVNARFDAQGLADEGRLAAYRSALRMIGDHPWFGTGQGTFAYAFPAYRNASVSVWGVWDMAHNSLLQIATDMGLPIAGLVVIAWAVVFATLIRGVRVRRRGVLLPVAALGVSTIAVLHSFVDFSLQIPGYGIVALSLIGAGLAQSFARPGRGREARPGASCEAARYRCSASLRIYALDGGH